MIAKAELKSAGVVLFEQPSLKTFHNEAQGYPGADGI
jgi:hypothetical protein